MASDDCEWRADGSPDFAHIGLSEHFLTKAPLGPKLPDADDERLLFACCRAHHHALDVGSLSLTRDQIPASVEEYAREKGVLYELARRYGHRS